MSSAPEPIEVPEEVRDRFSRTVAIAIVVATLSGALVGYLESRASRGSSLAALEAQRSLVRAMGGLVRTDQERQVDYHTFAVAELLRREAADVRQLALLQATESRLRRLERARLGELAERTQALTSISPEGPTGPERDPIFPFRFFSTTEREADRLWALADAASEEDAAWGNRETNYTAVLTLFAVAVYLLGLSLSIRIRVQRLLAAVGVVLIVVGGTWAIWLATHAPERAPNGAADAFAGGREAMLLATQPEDYRVAEERFTRAIELRPTFAQAYVERAGARFLAGSPQQTFYGSLTTPEALQASVADLRRALDLGLQTRAVTGELGFETFLLGLEREDPALFEESIAFTNRALELDPADPALRYNLAVATLATGDLLGAREQYRLGALTTIYENPDLSPEGEPEVVPPGATPGLGQRGPEPQGNASLQQQWLSGALTDLQLLTSRRPDLTEAAVGFKEYLVGSVSRETPGLGEERPGATAEVDLFPAELQWRAQLPGYDPDADVLSQQWYIETPQGWAGIPEVSGVRTPGGDESEWFSLEDFVTATFPARCLADGRYRVELYLNGHLVATAEEEAAFGGLEATVFRDMSVAVCRPSEWVPMEDPLVGFLGGSVASDLTSGTYVFRFQHPELVAETKLDEEVTTLFLDVVVENFADLFPAPPEFDENLSDPYFLGLDFPVKRYYGYPDGWVLGGAGVAGDGAVIVGVVFGPRDQFDDEGDPMLRVSDSLTEYAPLV